MRRKAYGWLHRRGIARVLNSSRNNMTPAATAYIETRGPRWASERLWRYALRHNGLTRPNWLTIRVSNVEQLGTWHYRWSLSFQRVTG